MVSSLGTGPPNPICGTSYKVSQQRRLNHFWSDCSSFGPIASFTSSASRSWHHLTLPTMLWATVANERVPQLYVRVHVSFPLLRELEKVGKSLEGGIRRARDP